jgi:DNA-binding XRE family transcriptional regulator
VPPSETIRLTGRARLDTNAPLTLRCVRAYGARMAKSNTEKRPTFVRSMAVPEATRIAWGRNLRDARLRAGYRSQRKLAIAVGCTAAAVSAWESGKTAPSYAARVALAAALHRSPDRLFPDAA